MAKKRKRTAVNVTIGTEIGESALVLSILGFPDPVVPEKRVYPTTEISIKYQNLTTDVATGSANLTVVNQVGMKLPITGTSALMLTVLAGGALMATAVIVSKKKKVTE